MVIQIGIYLFLILSALLTSVLSAIFGLAGGAIFFVMLTWALSIREAVPLHSIVQLVSNFSRWAFYFHAIQWKIVFRFILLILPGAYLGGLCFQWINPDWLETLVGVFILISVIIPVPQKGQSFSANWYILLGFLSSFLGMLVAVSGPLIASFFLLNQIKKEELVATKAVCQGLTQLAKIQAFGSVVGFSYAPYSGLILLLCVAAILGTFIGSQLLQKMTDEQYDKYNKYILVVLALSLLLKPLLANVG